MGVKKMLLELRVNSFKRMLICLTLILTLSVGFIGEPMQLHAEPITITTGVAIKVLGVLLASMGVLGYVNQKEGSLSRVYEKMSLQYEKLFKNNFGSMLFDILSTSLKNGVKMSFHSVSDFVKDFLFSEYSLSDSVVPSIPSHPDFVVPEKADFYMDRSGVADDVYDFYRSALKPTFSYPVSKISRVIHSFDISDNYFVDIEVSLGGYESSLSKMWDISVYRKGTNEKIRSIKTSQKVENPFGSYFNSKDIRISYVVKVSETGFIDVLGYFESYKTGNKTYVSMSGSIPSDLTDDKPITMPDVIVRPIPSDGVSFPLGRVLDVPQYVGQTYDKVLEGVASYPVDDFLDYVRGLTVPFVNALSPPFVRTDEDDLVIGVDIPDEPVIGDDDDIIDGKVPWLSGLIGALSNMLEKLYKYLFVPKEDFIGAFVAENLEVIKGKLPGGNYISIFDKLKGLKGEPLPDLYLKGGKVFDSQHVNSFAETLKAWQRWFYYIAIALFNMTSLYKLIRGDKFGGGGSE